MAVLLTQNRRPLKSELKWELSQRVAGHPARSTRGMIEPTLAQFRDGRILMVMCGSNGGNADPRYQLPSHKWFSISCKPIARVKFSKLTMQPCYF